MYRVPAAPALDKRLRRAIYLAALLASFSCGLLFSALLPLPSHFGELISLGLYLGLLRACRVSSARGSIKGLRAIAAFSIALMLIGLAIIYIPAFHYRRDTPGNWHVFMVPVSMLSMGLLIGQWMANRVRKID